MTSSPSSAPSPSPALAQVSPEQTAARVHLKLTFIPIIACGLHLHHSIIVYAQVPSPRPRLVSALVHHLLHSPQPALFPLRTGYSSKHAGHQRRRPIQQPSTTSTCSDAHLQSITNALATSGSPRAGLSGDGQGALVKHLCRAFGRCYSLAGGHGGAYDYLLDVLHQLRLTLRLSNNHVIATPGTGILLVSTPHIYVSLLAVACLTHHLQAFDCFSPGSYISSRRQSVEWAGYVHPLVPNDGEYILRSHSKLSKEESLINTPPISPSSPDQARRPPVHHYPQTPVGMPFAALVRRLSYTSSRLPAKYANRQYRESAHKRPKTSSGALLSSSIRQSDAAERIETPIKPVIEDHSGETLDKASSGLLSSSRKVALAQHSRPVVMSSRPVSRRRTKSGEAVLGSPKSSVRSKGKGHKRPKQPLRSMSFMDDVLLRTPSSHKSDGLRNGDNMTAPASSVVLAAKDPNTVSRLGPSYATAQDTVTGDRSKEIVTPMTPDHEIEAQLAKHDFKRFLMPNLPTPPPTGHLASAETGLRSDVSGTTNSAINVPHEHSPASIGLRTPSPAPFAFDGGANVVQVQSRRASSDERQDVKSFTPGWPWHRRNSNSSFTSLLSPRLVGRQATSPSISPSAGNPDTKSSSPVNVLKPTLQVPSTLSPTTYLHASVGESAVLRLDRLPSPILPLRTSPLSQLSRPTLETDNIASPASPDSAIRGRNGKRPNSGVSRRSLSASFVNLGRKVASLGNSQAFESPRQNEAILAPSSEIGGTASAARSTPEPKRRGSSIAPTPSPKIGIKVKEWPWKSHSHHQLYTAQPPSGGSPLSSASSTVDEVQWSFKVHGAYPAASPSPLGSSSSSPSPSSSANGNVKGLHAPRAHSPVFVKSPLGSNAVQGDAYFSSHGVSEGSRSLIALPSWPENLNTSNTTPSTAQQTIPDLQDEHLAVGMASGLLSPDRAIAQHQTEKSFVVESRPKLCRNARSDDGGLAARLSASQSSELNASMEQLSTSAPSPGRQTSSFISGLRSPIRQASPSPSRNLTKIPEADEQELQTRRESWLASLRGKPATSKRRMSAADIFGLSPASPYVVPAEVGLPSSTLEAATLSKSMSTGERQVDGPSETETRAGELDFSKRAVNLNASSEKLLGHLDPPSRFYRAPSDPSTPHAECQPPRSCAISQSSLLSASRPVSPGPSWTSSGALANVRPFPMAPSSQQHRHTQSMPIVPQLDHAAMQVSGLGAPESSVLNASQAQFARVLGAVTHQAPIALPALKPGARTPIRETVAREDREKMRLLMTESRESDDAIVDDECQDAENSPERTTRDLTEDQLLSPELNRTPKLSYATSSSADSHPSTKEPRTQTRARILDMGTPVRAGLSSYTSNAQTAQELVFHRSSPSNRTSSSISNPNGPKNAFDILLSSRGLDSIDGLPQSRVASWARRDGSDDSEITMTSNGSIDDGRPRDIFDEGRVSVW